MEYSNRRKWKNNFVSANPTTIGKSLKPERQTAAHNEKIDFCNRVNCLQINKIEGKQLIKKASSINIKIFGTTIFLNRLEDKCPQINDSFFEPIGFENALFEPIFLLRPKVQAFSLNEFERFQANFGLFRDSIPDWERQDSLIM